MGSVIAGFTGLALIIAGYLLTLTEHNIYFLFLVLIGFFLMLCLHDW